MCWRKAVCCCPWTLWAPQKMEYCIHALRRSNRGKLTRTPEHKIQLSNPTLVRPHVTFLPQLNAHTHSSRLTRLHIMVLWEHAMNVKLKVLRRKSRRTGGSLIVVETLTKKSCQAITINIRQSRFIGNESINWQLISIFFDMISWLYRMFDQDWIKPWIWCISLNES